MLAANEAGVEIAGIDIGTADTNEKVHKEAANIFKDKKVVDAIEEAVKALGDDESKIKKKELEDAKELVTKYAVTGADKGAEKAAAVALAAKVYKALSDLVEKLNKE